MCIVVDLCHVQLTILMIMEGICKTMWSNIIAIKCGWMWFCDKRRWILLLRMNEQQLVSSRVVQLQNTVVFRCRNNHCQLHVTGAPSVISDTRSDAVELNTNDLVMGEKTSCICCWVRMTKHMHKRKTTTMHFQNISFVVSTKYYRFKLTDFVLLFLWILFSHHRRLRQRKQLRWPLRQNYSEKISANTMKSMWTSY